MAVQTSNELVLKAVTPLPSQVDPSDSPPPRPQIDLDQFVSVCAVVRQMCKLYDEVGGQISRDDFIRALVSPPGE